MKEFIGHYVAYRKLVSQSPTALLPESRFRLYADLRSFPAELVRASSMADSEGRRI